MLKRFENDCKFVHVLSLERDFAQILSGRWRSGLHSTFGGDSHGFSHVCHVKVGLSKISKCHLAIGLLCGVENLEMSLKKNSFICEMTTLFEIIKLRQLRQLLCRNLAEIYIMNVIPVIPLQGGVWVASWSPKGAKLSI